MFCDQPCRHCGEERKTPEDLEKERESQIADLEKEIREINSMISPIVDEISSLESDLASLKCELSELQEERSPLKKDLKKLKEMAVHYKILDKSIIADQDPYQTRLPIPVRT